MTIEVISTAYTATLTHYPAEIWAAVQNVFGVSGKPADHVTIDFSRLKIDISDEIIDWLEDLAMEV